MSDEAFIRERVQFTVKNAGFSKFNVEVHGKTGKGDGYLGRVTFVSVTGQTNTGKKKTFNLVIKTPTSSKLLRQQAPIREFFEKEIHIYDNVLPVFKSFLIEMGVQNDLDILPECLDTQLIEGNEIVILRNMKFDGFDVTDRWGPMSYDHIKLVLEGYGKWHAMALALKHKKPENFAKLVASNDINIWPYYIAKTGLYKIIYNNFYELRNVLKTEREIEEGLTFSENDVKDFFADSFLEDPDHQVILHGDGWTNNFLFKNKENVPTPLSVCIIDWQCSAVGSPVMDLSYFIYTCVDTEMYKDVKELLAVYYTSLSGHLRQLGCDASNVFSFDKLIEHWKRFSCYGTLLGNLILKFSLTEGDEAPDFSEEVESGKDFLENFVLTNIKNEKLYHQRVKNNYLHYIRNLK